MRLKGLLGVTFIALLAIMGCGGESILGPTDSDTMGQITDAEGNPLEDVEIALSAPGMVARTDAQGRYAFEQAPTEEQEATLKRGGRVIARFFHPMLFFRLSRDTGEVAGQVTDSAGIPIADVQLVLVQGWRIQVTATDADGTYAFPQVSAGEARISAYRQGYVTVHQRATVKAEESSEVNLRLEELPPTGEVTGHVATKSGAPIEGALVILIPERRVDDVVFGARRLRHFFTFSDSDGGYYIAHVPLGIYSLHVIRPPYVSSQEQVTVSPERPAETDVLLLTQEEYLQEQEILRMVVSGGFAGIHREILIQRTPTAIVLTDESDWTGTTTRKQIDSDEYQALWDTLLDNDVFSLKTNDSMTRFIADAFGYEVDAKRAGEHNRFGVYAPEFLAEETGEQRYQNIVQAILKLAEAKTPDPDWLLLPDDEESQARALDIWRVAQRQPVVQRVIQEDEYQILVHQHAFSVGVFDPATAEWVVIVTSRPQDQGDPIVTAIVRLDYQTLQFKRDYEMRGVLEPVGADEAGATMSAKPPYDWMENWKADPNELESLGDFWVLSWPAGDFGATMIVHANTGRLIYSATTVWDGAGKHLIP